MNDELAKKSNFRQAFKKRCFNFSISILRLSEDLKANRLNWQIIDQLIRSGTSIGANVVEGGNSTSKKEFVHYFQIALKSNSESLYWLALLKEINPTYNDRIDSIVQECTELKKLLTTIILNTKTNAKF